MGFVAELSSWPTLTVLDCVHPCVSISILCPFREATAFLASSSTVRRAPYSSLPLLWQVKLSLRVHEKATGHLSSLRCPAGGAQAELSVCVVNQRGVHLPLVRPGRHPAAGGVSALPAPFQLTPASRDCGHLCRHGVLLLNLCHRVHAHIARLQTLVTILLPLCTLCVHNCKGWIWNTSCYAMALQVHDRMTEQIYAGAFELLRIPCHAQPPSSLSQSWSRGGAPWRKSMRSWALLLMSRACHISPLHLITCHGSCTYCAVSCTFACE